MIIGFAVTSLHGGGAEFVVRRWINELVDRGHTVHVYLYEPGPAVGAKDPARRVDPRATVHRFEATSRVARLVGLPRWLRSRAHRDELDVMVSLLTFTNLACLVAWRLGPTPQTKLIISERNAPTTYLPVRGRSGRAQVRVARRLYRHANAVIAISHPVAGDVIGGYRVDQARCFVVPNPVTDQAPTAPDPAPRRSTTLALVGRLVPQKRPELFLQTLVELARRDHLGHIRGVFIGAGPLEGRLRELAATEGVEVDFRGWVEPWTDRIAVDEIDALLLTSSVEGFGNVLVEAAQHGLPSIVCSEALGVADAVVPGITGEFSPTARPVDLADAVERALTLEVRGPHIDRWLERFSLRAGVDTLETVLNVVANAPVPEAASRRRG